MLRMDRLTKCIHIIPSPLREFKFYRMAPKHKIDSDNSPQAKKPNPETPRSFQQSWKCKFSWLDYDSKMKSMFCNLCLKHRRTNTFTSGCQIMDNMNELIHALLYCMVLVIC